MACVKSIKGVGIKNYLTFVKEKFGEEGLQKIISSFDGEFRRIISEPILVTNWYDIELIVQLQKNMIDALGKGDESIIVEASKWNAQNTLHGVYRIFLKISDPSYIVKRASTLIKTHYGQEAECEIEEPAAGGIKATFREFKQHHWPVEVGIMGWILGATELTGVKKPQDSNRRLTKRGQRVF